MAAGAGIGTFVHKGEATQSADLVLHALALSTEGWPILLRNVQRGRELVQIQLEGSITYIATMLMRKCAECEVHGDARNRHLRSICNDRWRHPCALHDAMIQLMGMQQQPRHLQQRSNETKRLVPRAEDGNAPSSSRLEAVQGAACSCRGAAAGFLDWCLLLTAEPGLPT